MASDITTGNLNQPNSIDSANKVMNHIWENDFFITTKNNTLEELTGISYLKGLGYIELNRPHNLQLTEAGRKAYLNGGVKDHLLRKSKESKFSKFIKKDWVKNITISVIGGVLTSIIFYLINIFLP